MSILNIVTEPNPILRCQSKAIDPAIISQSDFQQLAQDMAETMVKKDGAGLAAPQIGKNIRLIAVGIPDGVLVMINPIITKVSWKKEWDEEGCLSIPNIYGKVKRHKKVRCKFIDAQGKHRKIEAESLLARVIQHEIDHLDGILFTDKAKDILEHYDA